MRRASCLIGFACLAAATPAAAADGGRTLLAIFAHPDDEILIAPLLARYAREGADVHLAIVTRGDKGASQTTLTDGAAIAALRVDEARCAAKALGIHPPLLLRFSDASLGERATPPGATLADVAAEVRVLLARVKPDVVITWGPEGGYGHPDHRLVGAVVTELVQRKAPGAPRHLLYPGIPSGTVPEMPATGEIPWLPVADEYLTVKIPYAPTDLTAARAAFGCHKSQFAKPVLEHGTSQLDRMVWRGRVHLRPWFGNVGGDDVFALRPAS